MPKAAKAPTLTEFADLFPACAYDLETFGLDGRFGRVLCAVVVDAKGYQTGKPWVVRADDPRFNPRWKTHRNDDRKLVEAIRAKVASYEIVAAYNGEGFDKPMLNTRLAAHDLPRFYPKISVDPFKVARSKYRMFRASQEAVMDLLGIKRPKTHVDGEQWCKAMFDGDPAAMDFIVEHCVLDALGLWEVLLKVRPDIPRLTDWGSYR